MAEATIGLLRVVLASNSAEFTTEMGKAEGAVGRFGRGSKKAEEETGLLGTAIGKLTAGFTAALVIDRAIGMVAGFGREAFDSAGKILDLSSKTGLTTRSIQEMEMAAKLTGTSLEAFTNAAFQLGVRLSGGDKSVRSAVQELGLSYRDLMALSPDQQFKTIAERLAEVENAQDRNKIAVELFGRSAKEILPAIAQGYKDIADSAVIAGDQQLQALDMASDALDGAYLSAKNLTVQLLGGLVIAVQETWRTFKEATDTALTPFTYALDRVTDAAEAFGLVAQDIPKVHGPAAKAVNQSTEAATALTMSWEEMTKVSEKLTTAVTKKTTAVRAATIAVQAMQGPAAELGLLESRSIQDTARLTVELERWARVNGAVLAPSIDHVSAALEAQTTLVSTMTHEWAKFAPTVTQNVASAGTATESFFQRVFGGAEGLGSSVSSIFQQAFTGGGGALGAVKSFSTQALSVLLDMIPGVGSWVSAFAGPIVAMISKLTKKFSDFFSKIFGGPSADELAGRELVDAFEDSLAGILTEAQKAEAGTDAWKQTVIALRDAYLAAGRTEEEALADAERLWESSKEGAEAAARVIEDIKRKIDALPSNKTIDIDVNYSDGNGAPPSSGPSSTGIQSAFPSIPSPSRVMAAAQSAPAFKSGGAAGTTITNNYLPVVLGAGMSSRQVAQAAASHLASTGLPLDEGGITTAIESVIENYLRTYTRA